MVAQAKTGQRNESNDKNQRNENRSGDPNSKNRFLAPKRRPANKEKSEREKTTNTPIRRSHVLEQDLTPTIESEDYQRCKDGSPVVTITGE